MGEIEIIPFEAGFRQAVIDLTIDVWTPIFAKTKREVPGFVFEAFYPDGWAARQKQDVGHLLDSEPANIWLAVKNGRLVGFLGLRFHDQDQMGEIYIIAVAPQYQGQGIGRKLMQFAQERTAEMGLSMLMVETIGDTGHAPARRAYEAFGFEEWPVARYFKKL
ncbi:GNAT family N-acetyltransferase [Maritalea mediterranea]|uniref:GNAT family N-acetyltransferase n=1 Tax=Maritalea mediterranea TaxID=2909667 RepID=A0ABS9E4Z5_9HYPH|nr:GNAT family N-acetyltransferase [Maritalea mediterranea]MCF4097916.1 GNAT family N-acetyltransferase [Maritalea mediterranea]